ncbi:MAG: rhodanese-related sulfurtransferase [Chitinophagales bacterium]|nr:rhodanese-related sulfurtransferase [Chitinophagales bacterium]
MKNFRTLLFYKYVLIENAELFASAHLNFCNSIKIKGRIIIADEGLNGTVSGSIEQCDRYMQHLLSDLRFRDMEFKIDEEDTISMTKLFVRYKKEIVHFGREDVNVWKNHGIYLEPATFLEQMDQEDTVILDVRNKIEWEVGKFKKAVTLPIDHFRDFPKYLPQLEKYKDKKILAYCTGGIRCEKATAFLFENGFKEVYHLRGGIIEYGKQVDGKDFDGKCYVFDSRITVDVNQVNPTVISHCYRCNTVITRMVNCANPECNNHFFMCEECGGKYRGCCTDQCMEHPRKRPYNGTGYYLKGTIP